MQPFTKLGVVEWPEPRRTGEEVHVIGRRRPRSDGVEVTLAEVAQYEHPVSIAGCNECNNSSFPSCSSGLFGTKMIQSVRALNVPDK